MKKTIQQGIEEDLERLGISAKVNNLGTVRVDEVKGWGTEIRAMIVTFENETDMNYYKLVGRFKEHLPFRRFESKENT